MIRLSHCICTAAACLALSTLTSVASADGREWNDGPVVNVASIRTVDGHFDDYMHWLSTTWKKQEEAAKKAGHITGYRIFVVEARGPNDPDILLVTEFKNWAALDHLGSKLDAVSALARSNRLNEAVGRHLPIAAVPWPNTALATHPVFLRSVATLREWGVRVILDIGRLPQPSSAPPGSAPAPGPEPVPFPWAEVRAILPALHAESQAS